MRLAVGLSSFAISFFAPSSISINQAKLALHFFQGMRPAVAFPQFFEALFGNDEILGIFTIGTVISLRLNQRPGHFVWQDSFMLRTPMRVNSVPAIATESISALRTNPSNSFCLNRLGDRLIVFEQAERGVPYQAVGRNSFQIGDLCEFGFLIRREPDFHEQSVAAVWTRAKAPLPNVRRPQLK
jgi:hypothetical protein